MWVVTRPAPAGGAIVIGTAVLAVAAGYESAGDVFIQETALGLIGLFGAVLVYTVIQAVVGMIAFMAVHGVGGRSSGLDSFPEE